MDPFPSEPGTYALILFLGMIKTLRIGKMGTREFYPGVYVYCGSAMGPGGLRSRLRHHFKPDQRADPRWHIDWLLPETDVSGCCTTIGSEHLECQWSQALANFPGARVAVPRFGASDCIKGCLAHLVLFPPGILTGLICSALQQVTTNAVEMR